MRDSLNKRYKMLLSVRAVLDANEPTVESFESLKERVAAFRTQLDVLSDGITIGVAKTSGITEDKNKTFERLRSSCFSLANAVWLYADDLNDDILKAKIKIKLSDYQSGKEVDLFGRCQAVINEAQPFKTKLGKYGFSEAAIQLTMNDAEAFSKKMNGPRATRSANSIQLSDYVNEFKNMDTLLSRLDKSVNAVMLTEKAFYEAYSKARVIGTTPPPTTKADKAAQKHPAFSAPMPLEH